MFCSRCGAPIPAGQTACLKCNVASQVPNPNDLIAEEIDEKAQITSSIPLSDDEKILWHRDLTHGFIHKEVTSEEAVTNKRCLRYDVANRRVLAQVSVGNNPEVVIMNVHRVNDSLGGGIFLTPRMLGLPGLPLGLYGGPRRGNLKVSGDVSLMVDGKIVMTIENVKDPQGLRQLIQALKRAQVRPLGGRIWANRGFGRPVRTFERQPRESYNE